MNEEKHLELRYRRLTIEGILRSLLCGLATAFCADFVLGLIFWFVGMEDKHWLVLGVLGGVLVGVTLAAAAVFYFTKFKPTIRKNARRIDRTGLPRSAQAHLSLQPLLPCLRQALASGPAGSQGLAEGFPGGPVAETLCSHGRVPSSIPGQGTRSHMPPLRPGAAEYK